MNVKNINIKDIRPYKNNAKKHDETQINNVAESIKQYGIYLCHDYHRKTDNY